MSPSGSISEPLQHTFASPPFLQATVSDAMRMGVLSCRADTPLREVARIMVTNRVHAVVVTDLDGRRPWGVLSGLDLVGAAQDGLDDRVAHQAASTEFATIAADETLVRATQLMVERDFDHLIVIQPQSGHPVGVLSTLDIAGVLAWGDRHI